MIVREPGAPAELIDVPAFALWIGESESAVRQWVARYRPKCWGRETRRKLYALDDMYVIERDVRENREAQQKRSRPV